MLEWFCRESHFVHWVDVYFPGKSRQLVIKGTHTICKKYIILGTKM